jgi:hypothetical protein
MGQQNRIRPEATMGQRALDPRSQYGSICDPPLGNGGFETGGPGESADGEGRRQPGQEALQGGGFGHRR